MNVIVVRFGLAVSLSSVFVEFSFIFFPSFTPNSINFKFFKTQVNKMHIKEERNLNYEPEIAKEGVFLKPLPIPPKPKENKWWFEGLKPTERLFYHQTLSSARRYVPFKQNEYRIRDSLTSAPCNNEFFHFPRLIPKCAMDNALMSHFDQTKSLFPNKIDICLTNETKGMRTFRRLRNYTETVVFEPEHQRGIK